MYQLRTWLSMPLSFIWSMCRKANERFIMLNGHRKEITLPTVLSEGEVKLLFDHTKNIKHRAILYLIYSAGLRISELLNLTWNDLDPLRGVINVRGGKGKKDRITLLSPLAYRYLQQYRERYRPTDKVFEGDVVISKYAFTIIPACPKGAPVEIPSTPFLFQC